MDLSIIFNLFSSQEVQNFIAAYVAEKVVDGIINYVKKKFSKNSLEYELIEALEDSLNETCLHYSWEYDSSAIVETFVISLNSFNHIDSDILLKKVLEDATEQMIDEDILNFWVFSFHKQVAKPERSWLNNYIAVNHLYFNSKVLNNIENKLLEEHNAESAIETAIDKIQNYYNVDILLINTEFIKKIQNKKNTNELQERFYKVSSNFDVLIEAIINRWDVVYVEVIDYIKQNINKTEGGILITGNGGMGKTTCMLHVAVEMALQNKTVIWIDLNNSQQYIKNNHRFINKIFEEILTISDEKIYLFVENPFANFQLSQELFGLENNSIKIIVSERINRFEQIFLEDLKGNTQYWLENSNIIFTGDYDETTYKWMNLSTVKKFDVIELYVKSIIDKIKQYFINKGFHKELLDKAIDYSQKNANENISIVEQIYIILNYYIQTANDNLIVKNETKLDWDEWEALISQYTGKNEKYSFAALAIIYLFKLSLDTPTIAKLYNKSEAQISNWAMNVFSDGIIEPLVFKNKMFMLKHDMISELYFQFNKKMDPLQVLENTIPYLSSQLLEKFCFLVLNKRVILNGIIFSGFFSSIDIIKRFENNSTILESFEKNNCLVYFELAKYFASSNKNSDIEKIGKLEYLINKYKGKKGENLLLFEKALFFEKNRDYFKAKKIYETILSDDIDNIVCAVQLGHLCLKINYMKQAEKIFKQLVLDNDNNIPYIIELCKIYISTARIDDAKKLYIHSINRKNYNIQLVQDLGKIYVENGEDEEAEKLYNTALQKTPNSILLYLELGRLYLRQGKEDEAEKYFLKGLKINPKQTQLIIDLGHMYIKQGRENEAIDILKDLKKVKSNILEPVLELSKIYIKMSEFTEIEQLYYESKQLSKGNNFFIHLFHYCTMERRFIELNILFQTLLKIDCKNSILFLEYGKACEKFNKYEDALVSYLQSFDLDNNLESLIKITNIYAQKKEWSKIDKLHNDALLNQREHLIFIENYAKKLILKNEIKKAIELYQDYLFLYDIDYNAIITLGRLYLLDKDYKNAENAFESAIEKYPQLNEPILELGNLYYLQGQYNETENLYVNYLKRNNKDRKIPLNLAQLYIDTQRPEKAEKVYIDQLQNSDDLEMLTRLGRLYINEKNYTKAEEVYQKAFKIDPNYIHVLTGLIQIYKIHDQKEKVDELVKRKNEFTINTSFISLKKSIEKYLKEDNIPSAIKAYKTMLIQFPNNIYIHIELGNLYEKMGYMKKAIKIYKNALTIKNDNLGLLIRLGRLYVQIDYDIEIEKTFLRILEIENENIIAIINLSKYYIKKGRFQDAENILSNTTCTDNLQLLTMLGIVNSKKKNYKIAEEKFKEALKIKGNDIYVLTELGKLYIKLNKYNNGEKLFKKVLEINENDLIVTVELARLYAKKRQNSDAIIMFEKALKIDEKSVQVLFTYSTFLYSINIYDKASVLLEKLLKEKPNDIQALCILQDIYYQLNDTEKITIVETQLSEVKVVRRIQELQSVFNKWIKLGRYENAKQLLENNKLKWEHNSIYKNCVDKINVLLSNI